MANEVKQNSKDKLEQPKAVEEQEVVITPEPTVDFRNIKDLIEVVDALPTHDPVKLSEQLKIYNGSLYFYDYSDQTWKT